VLMHGGHLTEGRYYTGTVVRDNGLVDVTNEQNERQGYKPEHFKPLGRTCPPD